MNLMAGVRNVLQSAFVRMARGNMQGYVPYHRMCPIIPPTFGPKAKGRNMLMRNYVGRYESNNAFLYILHDDARAQIYRPVVLVGIPAYDYRNKIER